MITKERCLLRQTCVSFISKYSWNVYSKLSYCINKDRKHYSCSAIENFYWTTEFNQFILILQVCSPVSRAHHLDPAQMFMYSIKESGATAVHMNTDLQVTWIVLHILAWIKLKRSVKCAYTIHIILDSSRERQRQTAESLSFLFQQDSPFPLDKKWKNSRWTSQSQWLSTSGTMRRINKPVDILNPIQKKRKEKKKPWESRL